MTPAARHQAAIEILDDWLGGARLEKALSGWARAHRFAGSKDRAAIRDIVFDCVRTRRSSGFLGGGVESGRALVLGRLRAAGADPGEVFSGVGHAPHPLTGDERTFLPAEMPGMIAANLPDWLGPVLGDAALSLGAALSKRAPIFLRVNLLKTDRDGARAALSRAGVAAEPHPTVETALVLTGDPRGVARSEPYLDGLVELQDASSQAVAALAAPRAHERVLDLCAGGGGKTLALAALMSGRGEVVAHDIAPRRMTDLPARAARAGARVTVRDGALSQADRGAFDLVFVDAPCSGSGSWRRDPEGKWRLDADRLDALGRAQRDVLTTAARLTAPGGRLLYATCSVIARENEGRVAEFMSETSDMTQQNAIKLFPDSLGDGFFAAVFVKNA